MEKSKKMKLSIYMAKKGTKPRKKRGQHPWGGKIIKKIKPKENKE
jgi:hypothetical protein